MTSSPLIERLKKRKRVLHDDDTLRYTFDLINPDGPEAAALIRELVEALEKARPYVANLICLGEMHPRYPDEGALQRHRILLERIDTLRAKATSND